MRCYLQAFLLCMVFTFFSLLYVFNQLASTLEDRDGWDLKEQGIFDRGSHDTGRLLRKRPGLAGLRDREGLDRYLSYLANLSRSVNLMSRRST